MAHSPESATLAVTIIPVSLARGVRTRGGRVRCDDRWVAAGWLCARAYAAAQTGPPRWVGAGPIAHLCTAQARRVVSRTGFGDPWRFRECRYWQQPLTPEGPGIIQLTTVPPGTLRRSGSDIPVVPQPRAHGGPGNTQRRTHVIAPMRTGKQPGE